jgi:hypothetical protein
LRPVQPVVCRFRDPVAGHIVTRGLVVGHEPEATGSHSTLVPRRCSSIGLGPGKLIRPGPCVVGRDGAHVHTPCRLRCNLELRDDGVDRDGWDGRVRISRKHRRPGDLPRYVHGAVTVRTDARLCHRSAARLSGEHVVPCTWYICSDQVFCIPRCADRAFFEEPFFPVLARVRDKPSTPTRQLLKVIKRLQVVNDVSRQDMRNSLKPHSVVKPRRCP